MSLEEGSVYVVIQFPTGQVSRWRIILLSRHASLIHQPASITTVCWLTIQKKVGQDYRLDLNSAVNVLFSVVLKPGHAHIETACDIRSCDWHNYPYIPEFSAHPV